MPETTPQSAHESGDQRSLWILLGICVLGLLLRLYRLGEPDLWLDEGYSAAAAGRRLHDFQLVTDVHPPLYTFLLTLWSHVGYSDWWLRFMSVVIGVATLPVVYWNGRVLFSARAGLIAAGLVAVLARHLEHSMEVRMYPLLTFLYMLSIAGLLLAARRGRPAGWVLYTISTLLLAYTQGIALIYVGTLALLYPLLLKDPLNWRAYKAWLVAHILIGIGFIPWLSMYLRIVGSVVSFYWLEPPPWWTGFYNLHEVATNDLPAAGAILGNLLGLSVPLLGKWLWAAPVYGLFFWTIYRRRHERTLWLVVAAYAVPVLGLIAASALIRPVYITRITLPAAVAAMMVLGAGIDAMPTRAWRWAAGFILFVVVGGGGFYFLRYRQSEEWGRAVAYLAEQTEPGDVVLVDCVDRVAPFLLDRYDPQDQLEDRRVVDLFHITNQCEGEAEACLESELAMLAPGDRVWIVYAHEDEFEDAAVVKQWLDEQVAVVREQAFHLVRIEQGMVR